MERLKILKPRLYLCCKISAFAKKKQFGPSLEENRYSDNKQKIIFKFEIIIFHIFKFERENLFAEYKKT